MNEAVCALAFFPSRVAAPLRAPRRITSRLVKRFFDIWCIPPYGVHHRWKLMAGVNAAGVPFVTTRNHWAAWLGGAVRNCSRGWDETRVLEALSDQSPRFHLKPTTNQQAYNSRT